LVVLDYNAMAYDELDGFTDEFDVWSLVQQTVSSRTCMLPVEKSFVMGNCLALISKRRRKSY
jgi:hypothetical protein